ncbi:hypothetical protein C0993_008045 [Termitomyces sp. T159_Od127]|nr:hypothetical protein C0993_008045 [Termitomyces sp. T159_Od127]
MSMLVYLPTLLSSIFRLSIYIFLRVIPTSLAKFILPVLYSTHILSSILFIPQALDIAQSDKIKHVKPAPGPRHNAFQTLVLSLPTTSRRLRFSNILLNTLLLAAAADYVVTPYLDSATDVVFTRVGAVYPDSVKIVVRYPLANITSQPPLLLYREITCTPTPWKNGPLLTLLSDQDWVDTVKVEGLWPNTSYESTRFKFVVSSCATPNFPYRGPWYRRSIKGFDLLADYLYPPAVQSIDSSDAIPPSQADFMLFLGDFIYADMPIYIGDDKEAYRRLYRRNYNSDSFRKIYERLRKFINNFGASGIDSTPPYLNASGAFRLYNSNANFDPASPGEYYYEFRYGDAAFFVMDTRRYRTKAGTSKRTMLGDVQLAALHNWLSRVNATSIFKFVITSVPFTSLWGHDAQTDSWAGFPEEKKELLKISLLSE